MYELVSVLFPFADDGGKGKPRPGFIVSSAFGVRKQVVVAYITTKFDEILETDIVLDPDTSYFSSTGLVKKSLLKLHRLGTFEIQVLKKGEGALPKEFIPELKQKLLKIFELEKK